MDNWLDRATNASTPEKRAKYLRKHKREKLNSDIAACRNCPLNRTRAQTVPMSGPIPSTLAVVGEAPGKMEDSEGVPFVGRSGKVLDQALVNAGSSRDDVVVLNTLACRPPKNRTPTRDEASSCRPLFDRQLALSGAWVVILLGKSALAQIRPGEGITASRGKPFWQAGRIWVPTFHPAYILRQPREKPRFGNDIQLAVDIAQGDKWWPAVSVDGLRFAPDVTVAMKSALDKQGWVNLYSRRLEDEIVITSIDNPDIPFIYQDLPRYTVEELTRLGEVGKGQRLTVGDLRKIHLVKHHLGGKVVV